MRRLLVGLAFLALAACASLQAQTPAQRVYAAQSDYNALLVVAVAYESQPRCLAEVKLNCSDVKAVTEIRKADNAAHAALRAAQDTVRTPGVSDNRVNLALVGAVNAITALRTVLTTYKVLKT